MNSYCQNNITFVLPDGLTLGGVTTWSMNLSRRLAQTGWNAGLIKHASGYNGHLEANLPAQIQLIECTGLNPNYPLLTADQIPDYLASYRQVLPSVIIPNWSYGAYAACAALSMEKPEIIRVLGFVHADSSEYYNWLTHYEPIIHRFVAVSQEIATKLKNRLPHRQQDIETRPYAVEVPPNLQRSYNMQPHPLQLIYAGRISEKQKRVSDLVLLIEALGKNQVNFQFKIVGDGSDKEILRQKIKLLKPSIQQRVSLEGSVLPEQMPAVWQAADIFVLVSDYEGTSIAMLEAMAQGCVPVVTQVSGTTAVIRPEQNGFTVPVGEITDMAAIIKALDDDRTKLQRLGEQAHQTILQRHGYDDYIAWFLQMVEQVWQEPPRPWPGKRPLLPRQIAPELPAHYQEVVRNLSGQDIARYVPMRRMIQAMGFKLAAQPGLGWLHRLRTLGQKLWGG